MSADTLESQRDDPPREWVKLRQSDEESFSEGDFAKAFSNFVRKFYWRPMDDGDDELHVLINSYGDKSRYKYYDVPKAVYDEMWDRAYFPEEYEEDFGTWFNENISNGGYEYDKHDA